MKKTACLLAVLMIAAVPAMAQENAAEKAQILIRAGSVPSGVGSPDWFTGAVRTDSLFGATEDAPYSVSQVTFEPGARTRCNTHPAG